MKLKDKLTLSSLLSNWLNLLRAISAGLVMVGHIAMILFANVDNKIFRYIFGFGHQSLMIFFVLSGFLVSRSAILGVSYGKKGIYKYIVDRLIRLYIVLIPALILTSILDYILLNYLTIPEQYIYIKSRTGITNFIGNLLFLQEIYFPVFGSNGPLWSLANEFWYYCLFPILIAIPLASSFVRSVILAVCAMIIFSILPVPIIKYFVVWLIGAGVWLIDRQLIIKTRFILCAFIFILLISGFDFAQVKYVGFAFDVSMSIMLGLLINNLRYSQQKQNDWHDKFKVDLFANFSYSLYLIHFPILIFISVVIIHSGIKLSISFLGMIVFLGVTLSIYLLSFIFGKITELNTGKLKDYFHTII